MEKGLKSDHIRKSMGSLVKPKVYGDNYYRLTETIDVLNIKGHGVVLVSPTAMCFVPGVLVVENEDGGVRLMKK